MILIFLLLVQGMTGLLWAKMLHHYGFRQVTITETVKSRLKIAENLPY